MLKLNPLALGLEILHASTYDLWEAPKQKPAQYAHGERVDGQKGGGSQTVGFGINEPPVQVQDEVVHVQLFYTKQTGIG